MMVSSPPEWVFGRHLWGKECEVDPETPAAQQDLDEGFESIVVLEPLLPFGDDDWMPGEFDIA